MQAAAHYVNQLKSECSALEQCQIPLNRQRNEARIVPTRAFRCDERAFGRNKRAFTEYERHAYNLIANAQFALEAIRHLKIVLPQLAHVPGISLDELRVLAGQVGQMEEFLVRIKDDEAIQMIELNNTIDEVASLAFHLAPLSLNP